MFICEFCGKNSNPGESCNMVVTKKRAKTYNNGNEITQGWEIVHEQSACTNCYKGLK